MAEPHPRFKVGDVVPLRITAGGSGIGGRLVFDVDGSGVGFLCQYLPDVGMREDYVKRRMEELRGAAHSETFVIEEVGADVRTLGVAYRPTTGERHKDFSTAVNEQVESEFLDWPVEGPSTTRWLIEHMMRSGTSPLDRHFRWVRDAEIMPGDRSYYEHETLSRMVELALCFDQLAIANLDSFEIPSRRMQLLEQAHLENSGAPDYSSASHYMGVQKRRGGALISPLLNSHVAGKLKDESAVSKEKRKAKESEGNRTLGPGKGKASAKSQATAGAAQ
jgi:hypothetical protein